MHIDTEYRCYRCFTFSFFKKTPVANSEYSTIIHEGTKIEIVDDTMKDWKLVKLEDGREGWILTSQIERI